MIDNENNEKFEQEHNDSAPEKEPEDGHIFSQENSSVNDGEYRGTPAPEFRRETIYRVPPETTSAGVYGSSGQGYYNTTGSQTYSQPVQPVQPKKKAGHGFIKAAALVLVCALVSAITSVGAYSFMEKHNPRETKQVVLGSTEPTGEKEENEDKTSEYEDGALSMQSIYQQACRQVVGISTSVTTTNIFGQTSQSAVTGTGFIISQDGYILTNYHVIEYAVQYGYELTVKTKDDTAYTAEVIGYEADNDVAVIKIEATGLNAVAFGNSDQMEVGDRAYAVGNPLGELTYTMTEGIVSATNRIISTSANVSINMFQISAAVNSGNSGGPVYNARGQVIGIVSAKYAQSGVEGLGFAIPINDAYRIAVELIENGYVSGQAYLGVKVINIESYVSTYYNLPIGAYVADVDAGTCAEKAGITKGDIITRIDSTEVTSVEDLKVALRSYSAGDTAEITVYRSGEYISVTVTLDEKARTEAQPTQPQPQQIPSQSNNDNF